MVSESVRPPKCKIGQSTHQPIGKNTEIQRNTHRRINVSKNNDLEPN